MDHLRTDEERRSRWYARHIRPLCVPDVGRDRAGAKAGDGPLPDAPPVGLSRRCRDDGEEDDAAVVVGGVPASSLVSAEETSDGRAAAEALRSALREDGFAVVTDVLTADQCRVALGLLWDYLEAASAVERELEPDRLRTHGGEGGGGDPTGERDRAPGIIVLSDASPSPVRREDPPSHSSPHFPRSVEGGILPFYGAGHSTAGWYLRERREVQSAFAAVHAVDRRDLITSLDGLVAWRAGPELRTDAGWFHVDQNPREKPGFEAVQGIVNLLPVTKCTGGNALVAGSHRYFPQHYLEGTTAAATASDEEREDRQSVADFYARRLDEISGDDWLEVDPNDGRLLDPDRIISCLLEPGDMLLWDSRVVHCSYPGDKADDGIASEEATRTDLVRAAGLVSMMPATRASKEVLRARMCAVDQARTLTHWADKVAPLGEERDDEVALESGRVSLMKQIRFRNRCGKEDGGERCVIVGLHDLTRDRARLVTG